MDGDWTHPVAHAAEEALKPHTHDGHGCSEDRQGGIISPGEYSRLLCVIGVLTEKLVAIADKEDPGNPHVVEITEEELIAISVRELKMETDPVRRCIRLKVED